MSVLRQRNSNPSELSRQQEFEKSIVPHLDALYRTALRLTLNREEAEDLVQETCLRAYGSLDHFDGQHTRAWLFTILRHIHISGWRHDGHGAQSVPYNDDLDVEGEGSVPEEASAEEAALSNLLTEDLERALDSLPEESRMMLVLAYVEEWSYAEIAQVMKCPIGTVMSRLHRARRLLEESLAPAWMNEMETNRA